MLALIHTFANEDGTEMSSIQLHPDAESMDAHMQALAMMMGQLAEELTDVFQFIELVRAEVFGAPGERASEMDKPLIEAGVPFYLQAPPRGRVHPLVAALIGP